MGRECNRENGSVTIEATISLTAFMFTIITILTIINACIVQAKISAAIHMTAKEMSQYGYLYSLTGLLEKEAQLNQDGKNGTKEIDEVLVNINNLLNGIENLAGSGKKSENDIEDILEEASEAAKDIKGSVSDLKNTLMKIGKDPKKLIFGMAKLLSSEALELAKSRIIAENLSRALSEKHFITEKNGSPENYLRQLGVVPDSKGSYLGGLDFSNSELFPYGSNTIKIKVSYDVKIIALLPINLSFHFTQTGITNGWLAGEPVSFKKDNSGEDKNDAENEVENDSLWTKATVEERSSFIRHMVVKDLKDEGYEQTKGLSNIQLFHPEQNEFVMIISMNPLYTPEGEPTKTIKDIDKKVLKEKLDKVCSNMEHTTSKYTEIGTKENHTESESKPIEPKPCVNANNKVILVIPQDEGLETVMKEIIQSVKKGGVVIEIESAFGNGAKTISKGE